MNENPTPIRHGDWRVIDGQLVDFSQVSAEPAPKEIAKSDPPATSPAGADEPNPVASDSNRKAKR